MRWKSRGGPWVKTRGVGGVWSQRGLVRAEREAGATGCRRIAADEMKGESEAAAERAVSCFALRSSP
ncbi:hypothetical protein HBH70_128780 [Parastagonospora nodorum]|nr:hypothetical protein HBH53_031350 [Parastagonospora nodorum]KAH3990196.1 hypothetical protein HBH52_008350 [Parastagonospora nodorum]KAH4025372.1 hypothetical protein HBI09_152640 [Parastagonospora nodorum]KAH4059575.1 hypothetical protein HBH49_020060 [Parastagonospora nodorum]KAH4075024.1 hypothetical protein HBH50_032920 [Parastagonospora nodorum]